MLWLILGGCATTLPPTESTSIFHRRCSPAASAIRATPVVEAESREQPVVNTERDAAVQLYSPVSIHIAEVMEVLHVLNRLARRELDRAAPSDIERVRRQLTTRLQLATLEVSSLVAEIECEVHRADEIQDRLKEIQNQRMTSQTILGIIFGGLANILSGGISMAVPTGDAANIASITGGALEVLFGTSANFTKVRQEFKHPRNHLQVIWAGEANREFFPPRVWRFLTQPNIRDLEGHSLRDVMIRSWREEGRLGESQSRKEQSREALLFGPGGLYDAEDLHVREAMLEELEASIQLMHQDLQMLLHEVLIRQAMEEEPI